jgi:hypothetical protein
LYCALLGQLAFLPYISKMGVAQLG